MPDDGRSRLGRGLAALMGDVGAETGTTERARNQRRVPIEYLKPNPRIKETFDYDRVGLELVGGGDDYDRFVVYQVKPNSPAAEDYARLVTRLLNPAIEREMPKALGGLS